MNNTNRALNRAVVIVIGLLTLLVGAALIAIATAPGVRDGYRTAAPRIHGGITGWFRTTPLFGTGTSWGWILVVAALVLIVVLLLAFIFRQGHGHYDVLLREDTTSSGSTVIGAGVAEQAIQHDLDDRAEILASHISTYDVRGTTVLKISVTCRRGESPRQLAQQVEHTLAALDTLLGRQIPALIQISGGFRSSLVRRTRVSRTR
ncbi:hypothetical protein [Gryllotalpicola protaetiae]|uniref:Alkaline shock response membrane anchor protein AmaP n=1 Tax=Gryllotalpicola protaetiae TaxID=2419771 RepID=A0A387BLA3_9MICO|nr:hypothetical protein [Gryllotalpicola protaetiae]AYG03132.1 hypothetical protein D7I44_06045 [Gryllotalpicola protaetiae]